jgi:hypothetical protein
MKMNKYFIFFFVLPLQLFCQNFTGTLLDITTAQPIEFATVYVSGTTNGTISDKNGNFSIDKLTYPCEIVVSHISYVPIIFPLDDNSDHNRKILMHQRIIELRQVSVKEKNLRKENIKQFYVEFFGADVWGRNAKLENEGKLIFNTEYFDGNAPNTELIGKQKSFIVEASAPLKIILPLLGYNLQFDLVKFSKSYNDDYKDYEIHIWGYYYFKPFERNSRIKAKKYNRNRLDVYYNSAQHFSRSLYDKKLRENGYLVFEYLRNDDPKVPWIRKEFELDSCLIFNNEEAIVTGLKNRIFYLNYYYDHRGFPLNLNNRYERDRKMSKIYFLHDECVIRKDGTRPGGSITFGASIGEKRVGATLPSDYYPDY